MLTQAKHFEPFVKAEIRRMKPPKTLNREVLFEFSVRKWTYEEILRWIAKYPDDDILNLLYRFASKMTNFQCFSITPRQKLEYAIANDLAEWMIDIVCGPENAKIAEGIMR